MEPVSITTFGATSRAPRSSRRSARTGRCSRARCRASASRASCRTSTRRRSFAARTACRAFRPTRRATTRTAGTGSAASGRRRTTWCCAGSPSTARTTSLTRSPKTTISNVVGCVREDGLDLGAPRARLDRSGPRPHRFLRLDGDHADRDPVRIHYRPAPRIPPRLARLGRPQDRRARHQPLSLRRGRNARSLVRSARERDGKAAASHQEQRPVEARRDLERRPRTARRNAGVTKGAHRDIARQSRRKNRACGGRARQRVRSRLSLRRLGLRGAPHVRGRSLRAPRTPRAARAERQASPHGHAGPARRLSRGNRRRCSPRRRTPNRTSGCSSRAGAVARSGSIPSLARSPLRVVIGDGAQAAARTPCTNAASASSRSRRSAWPIRLPRPARSSRTTWSPCSPWKRCGAPEPRKRSSSMQRGAWSRARPRTCFS